MLDIYKQENIVITDNSGKKIQLLIICTDSASIYCAEVIFCDIDGVIEFTADPQKALDLFRERIANHNPFDAVFSDYKLSGTDGITLAGDFKAIDPGIEIFFFFSGSMNNEEIRDRYTRLFGFDKETIKSYDQLATITGNLIRNKLKFLQRRNPGL